MSLKLRTKRLQVRRSAGEGRTQTVAEGGVTLPDGLPPIGRALEIKANPVVTQIEPSDDRVFVEGYVDLSLVYASFASVESAGDSEDESDEDAAQHVEESLHRADWERALTFTYLLDLPGATEESTVDVTAAARGTTYDVQSDDRLEVDVVVELFGTLSETETAQITVRADGPSVEAESEEIRLRELLGDGAVQHPTMLTLALGGRSTPHTVLDVDVQATVADVSVRSGEVVVRGHLDCGVLYMGSEGAGAQFVEGLKAGAFEVAVPIAGATDSASAATDVKAKVKRFTLEEADAGSALVVDVDLAIRATAFRTDVLSCITHLTASDIEVAARNEPLSVYEAVGEGQARLEVDGVLEMTQGSPVIDRLLKATADLNVQDVHVLGDKVAVEGEVSVSVLYVGRGDEAGSVFAAEWPNAIPLDIEIPLPGAEPGLDRHVAVKVRRVDLDLINRETVEVRVQLVADAEVGRQRDVDTVVEAVAVPPVDPDPATFTFVVVQPGDTLWKLAQLYRTSVEAILETNDGLDPNVALQAGSKVCIVRKAAA